MYCNDFIFDEIKASDQGFIIVAFDSPAATADAGSKIEFSTVSPSDSGKWLKTSTKYTEPLTFTFSIAKNMCGRPKHECYFNHEDIAFVMRWLVRNEYCFLHLLQDDFEDIFYQCRLQVTEHRIGGKTIGFDIEGTCDAPFGYGEEIEFTLYHSSDTQQIYDTSDEIAETHPYMEITCITEADDATVTIENVDTHEFTIIKGCKNGEKITIDQNFQICTDRLSHTSLADDFNYHFFHFGNTFENRVTNVKVTNCDVLFKYRPVRKGGC